MSPRTPVVWQRTGAGEVELRNGRLALSARVRQLLLLIDGRRDEAELIRLLTGREFDEHLQRLAAHQLIRPVPDDTVAAAPSPAERSPLPPVPVATFDGLALARDVAAGGDSDSLEQTRARMIGALNELIGEHGGPLTARLQRCTAVRELRELLPATLSIVEAVAGPSATHDFLDRAGRI